MRWRINGIPPDSRKHARDAAKAAGLPLGPWLERAIQRDVAQAETRVTVAAIAAADERAITPPPTIAVEVPVTATQAADDTTPPGPAEQSLDSPPSAGSPTRPADVIVAAALAIGVVVASWLWLPLIEPPPQDRETADRAIAVTGPAANTTPDTPPATSATAARQEPRPDTPSPPDSRDRPAQDATPSPSPPQRAPSPPPPAGSLPLPQIMAELQRQALNGDAMAQHNLGLAYVNGRGVPQNYQIAAGWFEKASAAGLERVQYNLAVLYENALGVPQDLERAFELYRAAAEQGFAPAQHTVGVAYAQARGVARDYRAAALWFRRAADQNIPSAQYNLGMIYEMGLAGPADPQTAYGWYRRAAAGGSEAAVSRMAAMEGRITPTTGSAPTGKPPPPTRAQIAEIQQLLGRLSFSAGAPDGKIGPATRAAIRQYEQIAGLKVTGEATVALLDHLRQVTGMMQPNR